MHGTSRISPVRTGTGSLLIIAGTIGCSLGVFALVLACVPPHRLPVDRVVLILGAGVLALGLAAVTLRARGIWVQTLLQSLAAGCLMSGLKLLGSIAVASDWPALAGYPGAVAGGALALSIVAGLGLRAYQKNRLREKGDAA